MQEVWLSVRGYEGLYEVSDLGRVRSVGRVVPHRLKGKKTIPTRILKQGKGSHGYLTVSLWQNNKGRTHCAHSLVASSFLTIEPGLDINHIDGVKTNNQLSNLEVCTRSENMKHAVANGLSRGCVKVKGTAFG